MHFRNLYLLVFLSVTSLHAQKEAYNWYFGWYAGLTFNTNPPSGLTNGQMFTVEGCATISSPDGKLLFYTEGISVWDSTHEVMTNGIDLKGNISSTQSALIVPRPDHPNNYYIFTVAYQGTVDGLQYSEVDMSLRDGRGDLLSYNKNTMLKTPVCEKLCATKHSNGHDYWVVAVKYNSDSIFSYKVTASGVSKTPVGSRTGLFITKNTTGFSAIGCVKISFNGKKIVHTNTDMDTSAIGDFDVSTGKVSNIWKFFNPNAYGIEFSPNTKFLYLTRALAATLGSDSNLFQYDLSSGTASIFSSSKKTITTNLRLAQLQLGPDGKIYIAAYSNGGDSISVLHSPDSVDCKLQRNYISISPKVVYLGLPGFVTSLIQDKIDHIYDTTLCSGDSFILSGSNIANCVIKWSTGETTKSIKVKKQGTYIAEVKWPDGYLQYNTFKVGSKTFIGNDTVFCGKLSHSLNAGNGFKQYIWNTGATTPQITVNAKGAYSVTCVGFNGCLAEDTINIDVIPPPVIKLAYDSITCKYVYLSTDKKNGLSYLWNTGATTLDITVKDKGWYSVTASHPLCSIADSLLVNHLAMPDADLGADKIICANNILLMTDEEGNYLWNTMETTSSIIINTLGRYWLRVSRNNCVDSDTIDVKLCDDMLYYIPNAFTPNGDSINDVFRVYGSNIKNVEMCIFNRWGEILLKTENLNSSWDGMYKNEPCEESVYFYTITLTGKIEDSPIEVTGRIQLSR